MSVRPGKSRRSSGKNTGPDCIKLADSWVERLGPAVSPFQRRAFPREILAGEATLFADDTFELVPGQIPEACVLTNPETIRDDAPRQSRYLWIIDEAGLRLIREETPNPAAVRGIVCHTNITGGQPDFQGGELWFGTDNILYINFLSGRYGSSDPTHQLAVLDYFRSLGFDVAEV